MFVLRRLRNNTNLIQKFPFCEQRRWMKAVDSAQTRLENRTRDSKLDKLSSKIKTLNTILHIHQLMSTRKRGPFVSVQLMSRWRNILGLNITLGKFLHKYPHVFQVFTHPLKRNLCCKFTPRMMNLLNKEETVTRECELDAVNRIKKLLMISRNRTLHLHALRLIRRELGLPEDFRDTILAKYHTDFRLLNLEIVELVDRDENLSYSMVEIWRENEYKEKWLSEFEVKYAFPINFPTGFKIEKGFRDKLKNWQRLPYIEPYERQQTSVRVRTCGGKERFEKRAVAVIHELLSLTVEKMVEVERLTHFRKDLGIEVNVRELLLKHPGIFYISTKGNTQIVFLREAYSKGCLIEPSPIYVVRKNMLDLLFLGRRNTKELYHEGEIEEGSGDAICKVGYGDAKGGNWVIPILESFKDDIVETNDLSYQGFDGCYDDQK